jgi:MFS family permease
VGSLAGAAIIMVLGDVRYKGVVVAAGILAYCAALVGLALSPWFALSLAMVFLLGVFDSLQATPRNGLIQLITPDQLRGRVSAFQHMMTTGMPAVGQFQSGAIAALLGAPLALITGAGVCITIILGFLFARPELRAAEIEAEQPVPQRGP